MRRILQAIMILLVSIILGVAIYAVMKWDDRRTHYVPPPYDSTRIRV